VISGEKSLLEKAGYRIAHVDQLQWEERKSVDGWPSRAGLYYDVKENNLCMRLIDYAFGLTEPRHVHAGSHAAVILEGEAFIDNDRLGPLDVILGPSNKPHGPLVYPKGAKIFSAFQGSYFHSEIQVGSGESEYRLIHADKLPSCPGVDAGCQVKNMIDYGLGRLLLELYSFEPGSAWSAPSVLAALLVQGEAIVAGETLKVWDYIYLPQKATRGAIQFPKGGRFLAVTMR